MNEDLDQRTFAALEAVDAALHSVSATSSGIAVHGALPVAGRQPPSLRPRLLHSQHPSMEKVMPTRTTLTQTHCLPSKPVGTQTAARVCATASQTSAVRTANIGVQVAEVSTSMSCDEDVTTEDEDVRRELMLAMERTTAHIAQQVQSLEHHTTTGIVMLTNRVEASSETVGAVQRRWSTTVATFRRQYDLAAAEGEHRCRLVAAEGDDRVDIILRRAVAREAGCRQRVGEPVSPSGRPSTPSPQRCTASDSSRSETLHGLSLLLEDCYAVLSEDGDMHFMKSAPSHLSATTSEAVGAKY